MTLWERLENWIFDNHLNGGRFTVYDVADGLGVTTQVATRMIQSHLRAQRTGRRTLYVLHREERTSRAVWICGTRTADARALSGQFFDDVQNRWLRAVEPDLATIGEINPRARRRCEKIIGAVVASAMPLLQLALDDLNEGEEGVAA